MKIDKFKNVNENAETKKKEYPYELTEQGELKKTIESSFTKNKMVYLTDEQYNKLKSLSENTKKQCDNFDDMKKQYIKILRAAIQKVKDDDKK